MTDTVTIPESLLRDLICNTACLIADRERDLKREPAADHAAWLRIDIAAMRAQLDAVATIRRRSAR